MYWVYYAILVIVSSFGVLLNIAGLPGNWLLVLAMAGYAYLTGWQIHIGYWSLSIVVALGLAGEVAEFVAGGTGARNAGGTKRGVTGAIIGGFLGAIFLSIIPIPIVSQIIGACAGAFIGAFVVEYLIEPQTKRSASIGWGAAKGRLWGILIKLLFGLLMLGVLVFAALPLGSTPGSTTALPAPSSPANPALPATAPTTN